MQTETLYKKGLEGEQYIASKITELGYKIMYIGGAQMYSITGNKFYSVDLLAFGFGYSFFIQAKNKKPRTYKHDTGMELWRYENLVKHQEESGLKTIVLFTDDTKEVYGEWIDNLPCCKSEHWDDFNFTDNTKMIYWDVNKLKDYRMLIYHNGGEI